MAEQASPVRAEEAKAAGQWSAASELFALRIQPLLQRRCWGCHGSDQKDREAELDLSSRESALRGGSSGPEALLPGMAEHSLMWQLAAGLDADRIMPPKETERLSSAELKDLQQWIDDGAVWPDADAVRQIQAARDAGVVVVTSGGQSPDWDDRRYLPEHLWAYQPLADVQPPVAGGAERHPIDAFINVQLRQLQLEPAGRADRRTLIRRVTFDLTGLPPTPKEIRDFLQDPRDDQTAFADVVDRLLDDPRYGEQWARHWLDVVRYADTAGLANDFERPNAWRYRDYVIRSFNDDKPYDQFVREQIAGDELAPDKPDHLIAVGFLRMGPWEQTGMSVARQTRQAFLDDVTDSVGQVFLSTPLQCCRCHDHKFDPIPTRDYYRIQAVFATTQFADRDAEFLSTESLGNIAQDRSLLREQIKGYRDTLDAINHKNIEAEKQWYAERNLPYVARSEIRSKNLPEDQVAPRHLGLTTQDFGLERVCRKNILRHNWELDRYQPIAFSVYSGGYRELTNVNRRITLPADWDASTEPDQADIPATWILTGGSLDAPAEPVTPGPLSCVTWNSAGGSIPAADGTSFEIPVSAGGRRTAFAQWVATSGNALALRSIVNRIWGWHFGQGIAANPNNFGQTGKTPTHPDLLDWLCEEFVNQGWSIKALHRQILLSDAWCRSSIHPDPQQLAARDPDGRSLAVFSMRRLAAEELRDAILAVTGELNLKMGGVPVRPEINEEAALQPRQIMGTYAPAWQPSPVPADRHRRSVYTMKVRGLRDPLMEVFNQPTPDLSCERRETSTVTPQVFALFNSDQMQNRAIAFATRLLSPSPSLSPSLSPSPSIPADPDAPLQSGEGQSGEDQLSSHQSGKIDNVSDVRILTDAFWLALGRAPEPIEVEQCILHWRRMTERHQQLKYQPRQPPTEVVRNAIEEMNGEPFTFTEKLLSNQYFVADQQFSDCDARTRALAEVCLVLLNTNEFITLD